MTTEPINTTNSKQETSAGTANRKAANVSSGIQNGFLGKRREEYGVVIVTPSECIYG